MLDGGRGGGSLSGDHPPGIPRSQKGAANGVAELDGSGKVPASQLPALAPAAHAASHQDSGGDEISIAGLSGIVEDPQYPNNVAIYREGGAASGNVYTTFEAARSALAAVGGGRIVIDASLGSPVVVTGGDMTGIVIEGLVFGTSLTVQDGATLPNMTEIGKNIAIVSDSTTSPVAVSSGTFILFMTGGCTIDANTGKASLYQFTGTANAVIALDNSNISRDSGAESIDWQSSGALSVRLQSAGAELRTDSIKGNAGSLTVVHNVPRASASLTQTNYSGTVNSIDFSQGDGASGVGVDDASLDYTAAQVQAALEYIGSEKDVMHKVTAGEVAAGFLTLATAPRRVSSVKAWKEGGVMQVNKQIVAATGATPDFDVGVDGAGTVSINNNGSATGLSGLIVQDDVLIFSYVV